MKILKPEVEKVTVVGGICPPQAKKIFICRKIIIKKLSFNQ